MSEFLAKRRQSFLSENYFETYQKYTIDFGFARRLANLDEVKLELPRFIGVAYGMADTRTDFLSLQYTAGIPIDKLRGDLDQIVADWERYADALRKFNKQPDLWAFDFSDRVEYNQAMQLVGITILLKREDLLPRVAALCDAFKGDDAIYDALLFPYLPNRPSPEGFFHADPYNIVIDAIDEEDPKKQADLMKKAVKRWYTANKDQPFHDTHKQIDDDGSGGYFGYWCFELAALTVILGIDDSSFRDDITYPKDLADYARQKPMAVHEID